MTVSFQPQSVLTSSPINVQINITTAQQIAKNPLIGFMVPENPV